MTMDEMIFLAKTVARAYLESMRDLARMRTFDLWYTRVDVDELITQWSARVDKSARTKLAAQHRQKDKPETASELLAA